MATLSGLALCPGGNHLVGTLTFADGRTKQFARLLSDLRRTAADINIEEFIIAQVASIVRANPEATTAQLRTILHNTTFRE